MLDSRNMSHAAAPFPRDDHRAGPGGEIPAALFTICAPAMFGMRCAYAFGSLVRAEGGPLSDLDLAVLFDDDPVLARYDQLLLARAREGRLGT